MAKRIAKNLAEISATTLDLVGGHYPAFVYGADLGRGQVPVFCFHSAEPDVFEHRLAFLAENGYSTLTADEYLSVIRGETDPPQRAVVLTFDDGWGSLWSIGYPILRKYGLKIVVFLIPGRIEHRDDYLPNLSDLADGKCSSDDVFGRDSSEHPLLSWEEITEMHGSGLVDFQSHSYSHTLVCRSPRVVDFIHPELLRSYNLLEMPNPVRLGEPLYESAPRLSDEWRVFPPACIGDECASIAEAHGPDFFGLPDWRSRLWEVVQNHVITSEELRVEPEAERTSAVWMELFGSKRLIEEHLPGKEVRHICYPWHVAGRTALSTAREAGYEIGYMGKVDGRYYNRTPVVPSVGAGVQLRPQHSEQRGRNTHVARIGGDFFFRLPGRGRVPLARMLLGKFSRRMRRGSPYLTH